MKSRRRWIKAGGEGTLTEKVLDIAGIPSEDRAMFLKGTLNDLYALSALKDGEKAAEIMKEAIARGKEIVVYTDYDSDGANGGAVAVLMLRELGAKVDYYTNNRFTQGYGMCVTGIDEILEKHPNTKVIFTVDNGISAFEAAAYAKAKGLTLVITDHHEPSELLPEADAVVNPKRKDCTYPFKGICGAVVAWKVLRGMYADAKKANAYLDFLAIATVGDVVPLVSENRIIVKEGIKLLDKETRKSLAVLKKVAGVTKVNALNTLGFLYVPIINAVGRLEGNINPVIDAFLSEDEAFLEAEFGRLVELNNQRKAMTENQVEMAKTQIDEENLPEVLTLYHPTLHEGIVGLVAGRLKEEYNRPTIVLTRAENGDLKGSARSIEGFDMKANLDACSELLGGYGGHPMAAGLSLKEENLESLREKLITLGRNTLSEDDFVKKYYYVERYREGDVTQELVEEFAELEPFGANFPKPLIRLDQFKVKRVYTMGKEKNHLKLAGENLSVIGWRQAETYSLRGNPMTVSALGCPELNIYNNTVSVQFMIEGDNFM